MSHQELLLDGPHLIMIFKDMEMDLIQEIKGNSIILKLFAFNFFSFF